MSKYLLLVLAVMFMFVPAVQAELDGEISLAGKQSSVNQQANNHYIEVGGKLIYTQGDLKLHATAIYDFSNENIKNLDSDGEFYEVGVTHPFGKNGTLELIASSDTPYTRDNEELVVVRYKLKVKILE